MIGMMDMSCLRITDSHQSRDAPQLTHASQNGRWDLQSNTYKDAVPSRWRVCKMQINHVHHTHHTKIKVTPLRPAIVSRTILYKRRFAWSAIRACLVLLFYHHQEQ